MLPSSDRRDRRLEWMLGSGARDLDVGAFHNSTFRAEDGAPLQHAYPTQERSNLGIPDRAGPLPA
jgi:hypothetical protein